MKATEKLAYKKQLLQACMDIIGKRIELSSLAMKNAQDAANAEDKSSAGDKYETSRAMSHLDKDMYARQLASNKAELAQLHTIDCGRLYTIATHGSLVECNDVTFFIAAGLGKISVNGKNIFMLSPQAAMAKSLSGKKEGDIVKFNNKEFIIVRIY